MPFILLILFLSVCLTAIVVPFAKVISLRLGLISDLAGTFQSWKNIPLLGGFPHLFTLGVLIIAGIKLSPELVLSESGILLIILLGAFLVFVVGLLHDLKVLSPWFTLLGHLLVAVILVSSGVVFNRENQFLAYGLSLFYLVGATNAVKLQDDIDGLATGLVAIAAFFFGVIFYLQGNMFGLLLSSIVVGSTMAFLYYNFNTTQLLLGSNGNFLLGLMVGIMAVLVGGGELSKRTFFVSLVILALPILDTLSVLCKSVVKRQSLLERSGLHIYSRFVEKKLTPNKFLILSYSISILAGITAVWLFLDMA